MTQSPPITHRLRLVEHLRQRLRSFDWPRPSAPYDDGNAAAGRSASLPHAADCPGDGYSRGGRSSGIAALDRLLGGGGFRPGELVDWLQVAPGGGAEALSLLAAASVCDDDGVLVIVDRRRTFYAPAAAALGVPLARTIVVRVDNQRDEHWAFRQALGCRAVRAVWGRIERLDDRAMRRLQLAAEQSGGVAMLVRSGSVRGQPTWSHTQLSVQPRPAQRSRPTESGNNARPVSNNGSTSRGLGFRVELVRCRGKDAGGVSGDSECVDLELNLADGVWRDAGKQQQTSGRRSVTELARATPPQRTSRV